MSWATSFRRAFEKHFANVTYALKSKRELNAHPNEPGEVTDVEVSRRPESGDVQVQKGPVAPAVKISSRVSTNTGEAEMGRTGAETERLAGGCHRYDVVHSTMDSDRPHDTFKRNSR